MKKINNAIIAAAGMGRRLGKGIPKCLIEVNGRKIIEYQLELLKNIDNIVLIVGYRHHEVIEFVKSIRDDVLFVINSNFASTTTLQSYFLAKDIIKEKAIFLDGDMIVEKKSFNDFVEYCDKNDTDRIIGISTVIFSDAVYTHIDHNNMVTKFSRTEKSLYEWANLAYVHTGILENLPICFYQLLEKNIPLQAKVFTRYEVDTQEDLEFIEQNKVIFGIDRFFE